MKKLIIFLSCLTLLFSQNMFADIITFDEFSESMGTINSQDPNYMGFTWSDNWYALNVNTYENLNDPSGYKNAVVSGEYIACNDWTNELLVSAEPFNFEGAYFTAAWNTGLNIDVKGIKDGVALHSKTITVDCFASTWFDFNFEGIDALKFHSYGGTDHEPYAGMGEHFAIDNLTFTRNQVPEPLTFSLMFSGVILLYISRRKRNLN